MWRLYLFLACLLCGGIIFKYFPNEINELRYRLSAEKQLEMIDRIAPVAIRRKY